VLLQTVDGVTLGLPEVDVTKYDQAVHADNVQINVLDAQLVEKANDGQNLVSRGMRNGTSGKANQCP
jgi:hypothetical protein